MSNRKILVVSYYWFPFGGTGVYRISKFVKYLERMGWEPVILTVNRSSGDRIGEEVPPEFRHIPVVRTPIWEPSHLVQTRSGTGGTHAVNPTVFYTDEKDWKQRLAVWVRLNLLIPDAKLSWRYTGYAAGKDLIRRERPALILSTSPPPTAHMLAQRLARWSGLPWLADFRDPWTNIYYYDDVQMNRFARRLNRRFERSVLQSADRISVVNGGFFPEDPIGEKTEIISNGYDREDLPDPLPEPDKRPLTVCYTGSLKMNQYPECLIDALKTLSREHPETARNIRFEFYGHIDPVIRTALSDSAIECEMVFGGLVPHAEAVRRTVRSHLHLLIIGRNPGSKVVLSTKVFEYMMTGRPVLCIGPTDGSAADLVRRTGIGRCFSHADADGVLRFLEEAYELRGKEERLTAPDPGEVEKYDFRNLTRRIDRMIRSLVEPEQNHTDHDH